MADCGQAPWIVAGPISEKLRVETFEPVVSASFR